ncbi:MAG: cbb3-type cytochrome c oxidase subunit I [Candidatus Hydrothermarchaeales archaeon]
MKAVKNLTLRFYIAVLIYFLISCTLGALLATRLIYRVFPNAMMGLAHAHLALVGWVSMVIVGSIYQIVPVLLGTGLDNESLGNYQFWIMNVGVVGIFIGFLTANMGVVSLFGAVLAFSLYLFAYIIYRTIRRRNVGIGLAMKFFIAAIVYILVSSTFGVLMASGTARALLSKGYLRLAHGHLALVGWVTLTIMGAMYQMLPMLSLKELYSEKIGEIQFWTANIGVVGLFISLVTGHSIRSVQFKTFAFILVASVLLFTFDMFMTLLAKDKKAEKMDITLKYYATAIVYLTVSCLLGVSLAIFPSIRVGNIGLAHAHLALVGFVSITIMGAMYHLVPLLVWTEKYASRMGTEAVPTIKDLYSERLGIGIFWMINIAVVGFFLALVASSQTALIVFAVLLLITSYLFSFEMLGIIFRKEMSL